MLVEAARRAENGRTQQSMGAESGESTFWFCLCLERRTSARCSGIDCRSEQRPPSRPPKVAASCFARRRPFPLCRICSPFSAQHVHTIIIITKNVHSIYYIRTHVAELSRLLPLNLELSTGTHRLSSRTAVLQASLDNPTFLQHQSFCP